MELKWNDVKGGSWRQLRLDGLLIAEVYEMPGLGFFYKTIGPELPHHCSSQTGDPKTAFFVSRHQAEQSCEEYAKTHLVGFKQEAI